MADIQTENGYIQIASGKEENDIIMALVNAGLNATEYQVILFVIRKTWGWKKKEDWISWSQFEEATGKSRRSIAQTIKALVQKSILVQKTAPGKPTKMGINKDFTNWQTIPVQKTAPVQKQVDTRAVLRNQLVQKTAPTKDIYTKETLTKENICTPSQIAKDFFSNPEPIIQEVSKNHPEDIVRREIQKFILYWTEPNKSGTKQRWELEKTFEIKRRLFTWFSRIKTGGTSVIRID
jgi:phage replication O-like protein O